MNAFTIKDLENLSGIKAHTIRIWEQRYTFLKPQRTDTNIRFYSNSDLKTLLNVSLLNKNGFKISHINRMNDDEIRGKILSLSHDDAKNERIINDLIQAMIDLEIYTFEDVLDSVIRVEGYDKTITSIIFPFLERIGVLWVTNHMNPAQEHLVSNIIRQKLIVGINGLSRNVDTQKTVVVYLPENEYHELGILYAYYLFKNNNAKVLYLGASVPLDDLEYIVAKKNPYLLYTHITSHSYNAKFEKYLTNLHNRIPTTPVVMTGQVIQNYKKSVPANVSFKQTLGELRAMIETL